MAGLPAFTPPVGSLTVGNGHGRLVLLPSGAVWSPGEATLFVADCHLGKAAHFRAGGLALPEGETRQDLARLDDDLSVTGAGRLVVLGDLFHGEASLAGSVRSVIDAWRRRRPVLDWCLVPGNHDRCLDRLPGDWAIRLLPAGSDLGPFRLLHAPAPEQAGRQLSLAGHLHPAVRLRERGGRPGTGLRVPLFWHQRRMNQWVLPAYGSFTGTAVVQPSAGDGCFLIGADTVVRWERA